MYVYHRVRDQNSGVRADNWGFVAVLERHSLHPLRKLLKMAVVLNSVYIIADYMWFSALGMVSVAAGTSISNTAPFFVYLFSMCFLHEQASLKKLCGVLTSFIGVALITIYQDGEVETTQNTSIVACMLVVVQTMIVGGYAVAYRVFVGEEIVDASTILTLTGICGAVTIPVWLIGSLLFAVCPWESMREPLGLPGTEWGLFLLVAAASLAGAYTVLQSLALCWTTPLITSVGAMMTIPLSLVWDLTINGRVFPWECILGSGLVMADFGMLELSASKQQTKIELGK
ncbi:hypothetical protein L916_11841 [Phytophthora nicotianae]|uniref:EamA domain-containing protein n=2 Tax=Phytophthora nicotianae TaxID=4792 RepID=W2IPZ4_PHYNI|nr:hypothetical protein L916_11841 [Phytophthora nicotianae]